MSTKTPFSASFHHVKTSKSRCQRLPASYLSINLQPDVVFANGGPKSSPKNSNKKRRWKTTSCCAFFGTKRPLSVLEGCWSTHVCPYGYTEFGCPPVCVARRGYVLPLLVGDTSKFMARNFPIVQRKTSLVAWRIPKLILVISLFMSFLGREKSF